MCAAVECEIAPENAAENIVEFEVPSLPEMVSGVRSRVAEIASSMPFSSDEIEDIRIAVGEAATNALKHGSDSDACRMVIEVEKEQDGIKISVSDRGCGFDLEAVQNLESSGSLAERGRGIALMTALMDKVKFHFGSPGTRVVLQKRFSHSRP